MLFPDFYDFCERKRIESRERYINEGTGIGSAFLRKVRDKEQKDLFEMRIYDTMQYIRYFSKKATKERNKNLLALTEKDMNDAEKMLSYLKYAPSALDFDKKYGKRLSELEQNYQI